jgi:L-ascorbate metabolism protein UlaG (beta-lactamase superfamily)
VTSLIEPALRDDALLEDIAAANLRDNEFRLWWLGQSGFLLQWCGSHLLMDPYLSDSLTAKYAGTPTPHERMTAVPVKPERLDFINIVTASHIHTDHMDPNTLHALFKVNRALKFVIPEAERNAITNKLSMNWAATFGLSQGGGIGLDGFQISAVVAAHESVELDPAGQSRFLGYVIEFGGWTIYHSGDTVFHPGLVPSLKEFRIDVALLPINGRRPERMVPGNLNAREATSLGRDIGARTVIPCHYEMFTFNTASVDDFIVAAHEVGQSCHVLRCGERWESSCLVKPGDLRVRAHRP